MRLKSASGLPLLSGLATGALLTTLGAAHAAQCSFETECLDSEACVETTFSLTLELSSDASSATIVTDAENVPARVFGTESGAEYLIGSTGSTIHVLSPLRGEARYSVHLPDVPMVVSYIGTCSEG